MCGECVWIGAHSESCEELVRLSSASMATVGFFSTRSGSCVGGGIPVITGQSRVF